eukprot:3948123-Pyramimonas_sp.AAC.1
MARAVVGTRRLSFCGASNGTVTSKRQSCAHTIARRGSLIWSPLAPGEAASVARTRARDHVMDPLRDLVLELGLVSAPRQREGSRLRDLS